MQPIYLDYNATTPVDPAVVEELLPYLVDGFGNPSSNHPYGRRARQAVDVGRASVGGPARLRCVGNRFLTSGGTESQNQSSLSGAAFAKRSKGNHIITTVIEHPGGAASSSDWLEGHGFAVTIFRWMARGGFTLKQCERPSPPRPFS